MEVQWIFTIMAVVAVGAMVAWFSAANYRDRGMRSPERAARERRDR